MYTRLACGLMSDMDRAAGLFSSLLCYDKLIFPKNQILSLEHPELGLWDNPILSKFLDAGLVITEADLGLDELYQGVDTVIMIENRNAKSLTKISEKERRMAIMVRKRFFSYMYLGENPSPSGFAYQPGEDEEFKWLSGRGFSGFLHELGMNMPSLCSEVEFASNYLQGENKCLSVVIRNLPKIDLHEDNINDLIGFLQDERTIKLRRRLFNWVNEIERKNLKPHEIQENLATNLDDYQTWILNAKLKHEASTFESVLVLGAEIVENLLHLKPSSAVKLLFDFRKRELDLRLSELQAPGRELAFIHHVQEKFDSPEA